jgi:hypothetical protein
MRARVRRKNTFAETATNSLPGLRRFTQIGCPLRISRVVELILMESIATPVASARLFRISVNALSISPNAAGYFGLPVDQAEIPTDSALGQQTARRDGK